MADERPHAPGEEPRGEGQDLFQKAEGGHLVATEAASHRKQGVAGGIARIKFVLLGRPLETSLLHHQRIPKSQALAILASDALSSVAYATEEILRVLLIAGAAALSFSLPVAVAIVALLAIVAVSYRQTIFKYPKGGGTYVVTKDNLGAVPALIAGSSLMVDYTLTVAVSISAGVAAITSAVPALHPYTVPMALAAIAFITLVNLRGVRESAALFALPTYAFIVSMLVLIALGAWRLATGQPPVEAVRGSVPMATGAIGTFLILRAFSSGCSAMTGTEAISDGVPAFQEPQPRNAAITLTWMAALLGIMFIGITLLAQHFGILPNDRETVVSQIARAVVGRGWFYYVIQAATALILLLAANTSFSDFPRLSYFMALDRFLPKQFVYRGDRLAFSTGIIALGLLAGIITLAFGASVEHLIPLYAIGVFVSFTFSQFSMATRWWRRREAGWHHGLVINGIGAATTAVVSAVILTTKFASGAWITMLLIPVMVLMLRGICRHYDQVDEKLKLEPRDLQTPVQQVHLIVPVSKLTKATVATLRLAQAHAGKVTVVHLSEDVEDARRFREAWGTYDFGMELVIVESPFRPFVSPLVNYLDSLTRGSGTERLEVLLSELVPQHWWEYLLHNQDALRLKVALFFKPGVSVTDVPYHLGT